MRKSLTKFGERLACFTKRNLSPGYGNEARPLPRLLVQFPPRLVQFLDVRHIGGMLTDNGRMLSDDHRRVVVGRIGSRVSELTVIRAASFDDTRPRRRRRRRGKCSHLRHECAQCRSWQRSCARARNGRAMARACRHRHCCLRGRERRSPIDTRRGRGRRFGRRSPHSTRALARPKHRPIALLFASVSAGAIRTHATLAAWAVGREV